MNFPGNDKAISIKGNIIICGEPKLKNLKLRCPVCHARLNVREEDNNYECLAHGATFVNSNNIIRIISDSDDYFGNHWADKRLDEVPDEKTRSAFHFLSHLVKDNRSRGLPTENWLDVGTGDGVHLQVLMKEAPQVRLAGLDISLHALSYAAQRVPESVLMLADAMDIPLEDASVDAAFSYGVLAYLEDPWQGLREMARVTKPGGLIGVWFYPQSNTLAALVFRAVRAIVPKLPAFVQARIADLIVPILSLLPTASGVSLRNASWAACREVVLVNISPPCLMFPTLQDVLGHLTALNCKVVFVDEDRPITVWAIVTENGELSS